MRVVVVTGGRNFIPSREDNRLLYDFLIDHRVNLLIHGGCRGADRWAAKIAGPAGITLVEVPALWDFHGPRKAGPIRNSAMALIARSLASDGWTGLFEAPGNTGTADCVRKCKGFTVHAKLAEMRASFLRLPERGE